MNILFLNGYFYPENTPFTHIERDILKALVKAGHTVDVICPVPCRGIDEKTRAEYAHKYEETLFDGKVRVHRFDLAAEEQSTLKRFLRYILCDIKEYKIAKNFKGKGIGAVFAASTPPTQGFLAGKTAKKLGARCIYNVQDIFPDSLITTGLSKAGSVLFKIGRVLENSTYALCDRLIVISEDGKKNLLGKGVPESKLTVVNNWIDTDEVKYIPESENPIFDEFGIDKNKFTALYAGNLGASQDIKVIIDAAKLCEDDENIQFVIFGSGIKEEESKAYAASVGVKNLVFLPLQPPEKVSAVYSAGDACIVTCNRGTGKTGVPSKTWSITACSRPVLLSFDKDSDLYRLIDENELGLCADAGDKDSLAVNIRRLAGDKALCEELGKNARSYAEKYASSEVCAKEYVKVIEGR